MVQADPGGMRDHRIHGWVDGNADGNAVRNRETVADGTAGESGQHRRRQTVLDGWIVLEKPAVSGA